MSFLNPPTFATGHVLSASNVNRLLTGLDTLYGWYHAPWYGCDQQQFDATNQAQTVEGWAGWCILANNDTLVVTLANIVGGVTAKVYFDSVQVGGGAGGYSSAGVKVIALPIGANGWQPWTPYRVSVVTVRPQGTGELDVTNVYLKRASLPAVPTLPGFADGDVSSAADFNAISDEIRTLEPILAQPVAGCRGGEEYMVQGANTSWTTIQAWTLQHRLNRLRVSLFVRGPAQTGTISVRLRYNGALVNGAQWDVTSNQTRRVQGEAFTLPGGLTVGTHYTLEVQVKQSPGWLTDWYVRPEYVYQDQSGIAASMDELRRWTHGDYAHGNDDTPMLYSMTRNSGGLHTLATTTGIVNVVQREPITTFSFPWWPNYARRVYHVRRWRWLAYEQHSWQAQPPDTDTPDATLNWTYDGVTWDSYRLPAVEGGGYYDLDTSPIQPGMTFYASGVRYAIQTPEIY